jgi:hypothetical protein
MEEVARKESETVGQEYQRETESCLGTKRIQLRVDFDKGVAQLQKNIHDWRYKWEREAADASHVQQALNEGTDLGRQCDRLFAELFTDPVSYRIHCDILAVYRGICRGTAILEGRT